MPDDRRAEDPASPPPFAALIVGDEILSGKRADKHFPQLAAMMAARGLRLCRVVYLGDDRRRLTAAIAASRAAGEVLFSFGGIGNTPDDHTRQAAAAAHDVALQVHDGALAEMKSRFADDITPERLQLVTFPAGAAMIPNPFNRIAGFSLGDQHFVPGFPQMAWPMIEWVLQTRYARWFNQSPRCERAIWCYGANAYESHLLELMERIVRDYPELRLFSLPSIGEGGRRRHLELGVEGAPARVEAAIAALKAGVERRGVRWCEPGALPPEAQAG
jgi:molybdopterin-biosynthesis enzyme MoeA-like protein